MLGSSTPYIAFPRKEATIPSLLSFYRHFLSFRILTRFPFLVGSEPLSVGYDHFIQLSPPYEACLSEVASCLVRDCPGKCLPLS